MDGVGDMIEILFARKSDIDGLGLTGMVANGIVYATSSTAATSTAAMTNGQILIGQTGLAPSPLAVSGDGTLAASGAITITKTNGVAFATSATTDTTSATNITSGTLPAARLPAFGSGDVSFATGGGAGTIAANAVTSAKFRQSVARSVVGTAGNAMANVADIAGAGVHTFLSDNGTSLAFRQPAAADLSDGVNGTGQISATTGVAFVTPTLGVASATSINKVTITAPATGSTITIADGKTLTANNSITIAGVDAKTLTVNNNLTLSGTDGSTLAVGPGGTLTGSSAAAVFYDNLPQNSKSAPYTTVLSDAQKHILHPAADNNARTFTIDSNANVAYPIGTIITFINEINTVTISITSDTLTLMTAGTTGNRTLAAHGIAFAIKIAATSWVIYGTGLT